MQESKLKFYSYGMVANNKALNSKEVEVYPAEVLPYVDGEVDFNPTVEEAQGVDRSGVAYATKVVSDNTVTASWLPIGQPNRLTAPDVRRGERVMIWKYADTDQYFWCTCQNDQRYRKLETVVFGFSDTTDEEVDSTDPENCYTFEVSTHTGHITLTTVKANGEPFAYTLQLNTKEGRFVFTDDVGNHIGLDSAKTLIQFKNQMGTLVELNKQNITLDAPQDIYARAGRNITLKAGKNLTMVAGSEALMDGAVSATLASGGNYFKMTPAGGTIKAPKLDGVS